MAGGRIRTLKPELLEDERVAGLSCSAFRLFVGCILLADDYGNLRGAVSYLRGQVFWGREVVTAADVQGAIAELIRAELVVPYADRDQAYLHLRTWTKHQKVDHPSKPKILQFSESLARLPEFLARLPEWGRWTSDQAFSVGTPTSSESLARLSETLAPDRTSTRIGGDQEGKGPGREGGVLALPPKQGTQGDLPLEAIPPLALGRALELLQETGGGRFVIGHRTRPRERRNAAQEQATLGLPMDQWRQLRDLLAELQPTEEELRRMGAWIAAGGWGHLQTVTPDYLLKHWHDGLTQAGAWDGRPQGKGRDRAQEEREREERLHQHSLEQGQAQIEKMRRLKQEHAERVARGELDPWIKP